MINLVLILSLWSFSFGQKLPAKEWPPVWFTWVVTSVFQDGYFKPLYDKGQLIAFDATNQWACRYLEQNLLAPSKAYPVDFCDYGSGKHSMLNDVLVTSNCSGLASIASHLVPISYPDDFMNNAVFMGVDKVAQKYCNHFFAKNVNIGGKTVQMDVWSAIDDSFPCQISINDFTQSPTLITTFAFDGFTNTIPQEAINQCSAAKILCTQEDWVCNVKPGADQKVLQQALDWVCTPPHLNCTPINPGGANYYPNTLLAHCNWAFNSYYRLNRSKQGNFACDFGGLGQIVPPPSVKTLNPKNQGFPLEEWLVHDIVCPRTIK